MQSYVFKKVDELAPREGANGTGIRLKHPCGFCRGRFRTPRQRFQHASQCRESKQSSNE